MYNFLSWLVICSSASKPVLGGSLGVKRGNYRAFGGETGKDRVDPVVVAHSILSPLFKKLPTPFLYSDICHQNGWYMSEEAHKWPIDLCKGK